MWLCIKRSGEKVSQSAAKDKIPQQQQLESRSLLLCLFFAVFNGCWQQPPTWFWPKLPRSLLVTESNPVFGRPSETFFLAKMDEWHLELDVSKQSIYTSVGFCSLRSFTGTHRWFSIQLHTLMQVLVYASDLTHWSLTVLFWTCSWAHPPSGSRGARKQLVLVHVLLLLTWVSRLRCKNRSKWRSSVCFLKKQATKKETLGFESSLHEKTLK